MTEFEYTDKWDIPSFQDEDLLSLMFCDFFEPDEEDYEETDVNCLTCKRFLDTCKNGVVSP